MLGLLSLFGMLLVGLGLDAATGGRGADGESDEADAAETVERADAADAEPSLDEETIRMQEDFRAEFRAETGLFGEDGLASLFGPDAGADGVATETDRTATEELPIIEGYNAEAERLLVGYDPASNEAPQIEVETVHQDDAGSASLIRLDGAAVARVMQGPGVSPLGLGDIALVPISAIEPAEK